MPFYNRINSGKSEAASYLFGCKERVEYLIKVSHGYPASLVRDSHLYISSHIEGYGISLSYYNIFTLHFNYAPFRHSLVSIKYQIIDHLTYLALIHFSRPEVIRDIEYRFGIRATECKCD